jgi:hypothetical protein
MMSATRQKPNKVLPVTVTTKTALSSWPYQDFVGDPYWTGGATPKPYQWEVEVTVLAQVHGDPSTRNPYRYDGDDIFVGDWIADTSRGRSLKVVGVIAKDQNSATIVVEDVDRYNTFSDENGDGSFTVPGEAVIFEIGDEKMPILNPLPSTLTSITFAQEVLARFQNNNPLYRRRIYQPSHGLLDNQAIWVNPVTGLFEPATGDNLKFMVGTVDRAGPGTDIFYFIPTTKVVEGIDPPLPGSAGDLIWLDEVTGDLTTTPNDQEKATFIQLTNATPDTVDSRKDGLVITIGEQFTINGELVTISTTSETDLVNTINGTTANSFVSAVLNSGINEVSTISGQLAYGIVGSIGNVAQITINGTTVTFSDTTNGAIEFGFSAANAVDMANSINAAGIPNINAIGTGSSNLTIQNTAGGSINIVNVTNDASGTPWGGPSSCSGVPLTTPAGGNNFITLTNNKGSGIILSNITGTPVENLGFESVRNGELPLGLVVEQFVIGGSSNGGTTVYATLGDLPVTGDLGALAYVIDSDDGSGNDAGEWSTHVWDGSSWVRTGDQDSSNVDAKTASVIITNSASAQTLIDTLSIGRRVLNVSIEVTQIFDGSPIISVGDTNDNSRLMSDDLVDLSTASTYTSLSDYVYSTEDTEINVYFSAGGATQGSAKIVITYV